MIKKILSIALLSGLSFFATAQAVEDCTGQANGTLCAGTGGFGAEAEYRQCYEDVCGHEFCVGVTCGTENTGDAVDEANECTAFGCATWGLCESLPMPDGLPCDDGDFATTNDNCLAGVCSGAPDYCLGVSCPDTGDQCTVSACDSANGLCGVENELEGTICDDGDGATTNDTCQLGVCAGSVAEKPTGCAYNSRGSYDMLLMILLACGIFYGRNARFARR